MSKRLSTKYVEEGTGQERQTAIDRAVSLCRLLGTHWIPRVWENLGWHYCALIDGEVRIEVHADHPQGKPVLYTAFLHRVWVDSADDPAEALRLARAKAQQELDETTYAIELIDSEVHL